MRLYLSVKKSTLAKIKFIICYYCIDQSSFLGLYITVKHGLALHQRTMPKSQLSFLRRALELPRSVPTAALYLELGILPIKCEIAIRQLLFLKKILDKNENDPVS